MRGRVLTGLLVGGLLATVVVAAPASATYVGRDGRLAFVRANQIYTVANTGGTVTKLTSVGKNYRPKWSPDGTLIAFVNEPAAGSRDVWVMSATGTRKTQVTRLGTVTTNPTWSPDGTLIAFGAGGEPCGQYDCSRPLYTVSAVAPFGDPTPVMGWINDLWNGPDPTNIGQISVDRYLAWSPDGSRIAIFGHLSAVWDDSLSIYTLATGENQEIKGTGADCCGYADWSDLAWGPTGVFGHGEVDHGGELEYDPNPHIKIIYPGFVSVQGDKSPAPSPLNTRIAFVNGTSGTPKIYVARITGAQRKVVVTNGYQPDWQPVP